MTCVFVCLSDVDTIVLLCFRGQSTTKYKIFMRTIIHCRQSHSSLSVMHMVCTLLRFYVTLAFCMAVQSCVLLNRYARMRCDASMHEPSPWKFACARSQLLQAILPYSEKRKQLLKMTFLINEQNVSVVYIVHIDINAISLCLDLNIFQQDQAFCSKFGLEVEQWLTPIWKTSRFQIWVLCHLLPFESK